MSTQSSKPVEFSAVVQSLASKLNKDADRTGKRFRSYIRSHRDELIEAGWAINDHTKGDRYPAMPRKLATAIIDNGGKLPTS